MLEDIFASKTRARLMNALLGSTGARLSTRELIRRVGTGASSVQRELHRLETAGVLASEREGNARVFFGNPGYRLHAQLRALVLSAASPGAVVAAAPVPTDVGSRPPLPSVAPAPAPPPALAPAPSGPDPRVAPLLPDLAKACKAHGVTRLALFGVATQPRPEVEPRVDIVVRFGQKVPNRFDAYFDLNEELDRIMGIPVHIVEDGAVRNPQLREEIQSTQMVLYDS